CVRRVLGNYVYASATLSGRVASCAMLSGQRHARGHIGRRQDQKRSRMVAIKHPAPTFALAPVEHIAQSQYDVQPTVVNPFPGEHDQNVYLKTAAGGEFVLKLSHAAAGRADLDLQNAALAHLASQAPARLLPRPQLTPAGDPIAIVADAAGVSYFARLFSYLPGKLLAQAHPHSPALLYSLGRLLGELDAALIDFAHPATQRELKWDLARAGWIHDYLHYIASPERRALVEDALTHFEAETVPLLPTLRASVIYNDANDY